MPTAVAEANEILNARIRDRTLWLCASTALPSDVDGTGFAEPVGGGYARLQLASGSGKWGAAAAGEIANAQVLSHAAASADWAPVVAWGLALSGTAGTADVRYWQRLAEPFDIDAGEQLSYPIGVLVLVGTTVGTPT